MDETQEPMENEERKESRGDSGELGVQQLLGSILDRGRVRIGFCQAGLNLSDSAASPVDEVLVSGEAGSAAVDNASGDRATDPAEGSMECVVCGDTEGRTIKGQKKIVSPGRIEWDNHMRTHLPYRRWCPHCVGAKRKSDAHKEEEDEMKEEEGVPRISFDYMWQKSEEGKAERIDSLPITGII